MYVSWIWSNNWSRWCRFSNTIIDSNCISHSVDCAGDYYGSAVEDECGVCDGSGPAENLIAMAIVVEVDCAGECGGSALEDECGICERDGSTCVASLTLGAFDSSGSVEVLYEFGAGVAGFQFDLTGLSLTGG